MADITQTADNYPEGVYLLAVTDPVLGGPEGPDNKAPIALANRTNYQRMRNVTPWRSGPENAYPAHAYVHHGGTTWKSKVANANIEPGTDATKWIRWGYTADELLAYLDGYIVSGVLNQYALDTDLDAYLLKNQFDTYVFGKGIRYSATVCPNGGPSMAPMSIAAPTLALPYNVYKSALGEVWMYLDNAWRVVSGDYRYAAYSGSVAIGASTVVNLLTATVPRNGKVHASGVISGLSNASGGNILIGQLVLTRAAVPTSVADSLVNDTTLVLNQYMQCRPAAPLDVQAGDIITLVGTGTGGSVISPANGNALYYQYI